MNITDSLIVPDYIFRYIERIKKPLDIFFNPVELLNSLSVDDLVVLCLADEDFRSMFGNLLNNESSTISNKAWEVITISNSPTAKNEFYDRMLDVSNEENEEPFKVILNKLSRPIVVVKSGFFKHGSNEPVGEYINKMNRSIIENALQFYSLPEVAKQMAFRNYVMYLDNTIHREN